MPKLINKLNIGLYQKLIRYRLLVKFNSPLAVTNRGRNIEGG